jgi:hypothetical protein
MVSTPINPFEEAWDAYNAYIDSHYNVWPVNPYPPGSVEAEQFDLGVDDADWHHNWGQYQEE